MGPSHTHTCTHTHTNHQYTYTKHTPLLNRMWNTLPIALFEPPAEKYSVCVVPRLKFLSAYETADSSFMVIHLKPDQSMGTKSPKWLTLKVWDALVLGVKDWLLCLGCRGMEGRKTQGRGRGGGGSHPLFFFSSATRQSEWWKDHFLVIKGEVCDLTLQAVECGLMIGLQLFWAPWNTNVTVMCFHSRESLNPGVQGCISEKWTACPTALCCCLAAIDK